jgi:hypothetical protein
VVVFVLALGDGFGGEAGAIARSHPTDVDLSVGIPEKILFSVGVNDKRSSEERGSHAVRSLSSGRGRLARPPTKGACCSTFVEWRVWPGDGTFEYPYGLLMLEPDQLDCAVSIEHLVAEPVATTRVPGERSIRLDWNRLVRHPRLEPIVRKLFPDQRRFDRLVLPNVVGYLGRAHASRPHRIADISVGGFRMVSDHFWTPGTEMTITLQREIGMERSPVD